MAREAEARVDQRLEVLNRLRALMNDAMEDRDATRLALIEYHDDVARLRVANFPARFGLELCSVVVPSDPVSRIFEVHGHLALFLEGSAAAGRRQLENLAE